MNYSQFKKAILAPFDKLQNEKGEEFLELMVDTIVLFDENGEEISSLYGWKYNLSRSRHWDREQENHIMHDGFNNEHLEELFEDIMDMERTPAKMLFIVDGMTDLDEPIHQEVEVELNKKNA